MNEQIKKWIRSFVGESNKIEGISRPVTKEEYKETFRFIALDEITIKELQQFVSVLQPDAVLRDKKGLNVRVGNHIPPKGGSGILNHLEDFLECIDDSSFEDDLYYNPFLAHKEYEALHPFTDGNGRSGRAIWLWQMLKLKKNFQRMGFLHTWYIQSLSEK